MLGSGRTAKVRFRGIPGTKSDRGKGIIAVLMGNHDTWRPHEQTTQHTPEGEYRRKSIWHGREQIVKENDTGCKA